MNGNVPIADMGNFDNFKDNCSETATQFNLEQNPSPQLKETLHVHTLSSQDQPCSSYENCSWICEYCEQSYNRRQTLVQHTRMHTGTPFACSLCGKRFASQSKLRAHLNVHSGHKDYECVYCNKTFSNHNSLTEHTKIHTGQKDYKCEFCGKEFVQKGVYLAHLKLHTGEDLWSCEYCGKRFNRKSSLLLHIRVHTGDMFSCYLCNKTFTVRSKLLSHIKTHSGIKEYACDVCDRRYIEKNSLRQHYILHTHGKMFVCQICDKSFTKKVSLHRHELLHKGVKPFECPVCQRRFVQVSHMQAHLSRHHSESPLPSPQLLCHICGKSYRLKESLSLHMRTHDLHALNYKQSNLTSGPVAINKSHVNDGKSLDSLIHQNKCYGHDLSLNDNIDIKLTITTNGDNSNSTNETPEAPLSQDNHDNKLNVHIKDEITSAPSVFNDSFIQVPDFKTVFQNLNGICLDLMGIPPSIDSIQPLSIDNSCTLSNDIDTAIRKSITNNDVSTQDSEDYASNDFSSYEDFENEIFKSPESPKNRRSTTVKVENSHGYFEDKVGRTARSELFTCDLCHRQFPNKSHLLLHVRDHFTDNTISCHHCSKVYRTVSKWRVHLRSHLGALPYSCSICGHFFRYKHNLLRHMRLTHAGLRPFSCLQPHCHKAYTKKISLERHMMVHRGDRPFFCSHCTKRFAQKSQLVIHLRIHTGEKPFLCAFCGKNFSRKDVLMVHIRTHTLKHLLCVDALGSGVTSDVADDL